MLGSFLDGIWCNRSVFGGVATTLAVIVALWQTKYTHKKKLKIYFIDNFQLYNQNTGASVKYIGVRITNIGNRKLIVQN